MKETPDPEIRVR